MQSTQLNKWVITSLSTIALAFTLSGCGSDDNDDNSSADTGTTIDDNVQRKPDQAAADLMLLADGLEASYVTREIGHHADMMSFWPAGNNPTHLIACIEGGAEDLDNGKKNPSVQSINLDNGEVKTLLRGMSRCDGVRTTAWDTVLATEEAGDGAAYEIIDPLNVAEHTITNRDNGAVVDTSGATSANVVKRTALPIMAWEGLTVLDNGVVIGGDELRPGSYEDANGSEDTDGGAIFKFVPATPFVGGTISTLADSPLAAGSGYAMQVQCKEGQSQYGQGCEVGNAIWVAIDPTNARVDANNKGATGY